MTRDDVIAAVAQGWCTPENEHKEMDADLAMAIVDNVMRLREEREGMIKATYEEVS